jgi:hypothetical protein
MEMINKQNRLAQQSDKKMKEKQDLLDNQRRYREQMQQAHQLQQTELLRQKSETRREMEQQRKHQLLTNLKNEERKVNKVMLSKSINHEQYVKAQQERFKEKVNNYLSDLEQKHLNATQRKNSKEQLIEAKVKSYHDKLQQTAETKRMNNNDRINRTLNQASQVFEDRKNRYQKHVNDVIAKQNFLEAKKEFDRQRLIQEAQRH